MEWPGPAGNGPLVLGVLGEDPFGAALDRTFEGKRVGSRALEVRRVASVEEGARGQILFISKSEERRLPAILAVLRGTPVLTVSDIRDFAERGGMIGFRLQDQRVRFDIDLAPATGSGLKLSSQLLKLARIVPAEGR